MQPRKARAKAAGKVGKPRPRLRGGAQDLAGATVDQHQPAGAAGIGQTAQMQGRLRALPCAGVGERLRDKVAKLRKLGRVTPVISCRGATTVALHFAPDKIAQDGVRGGIAHLAGMKEALPKLRITGEGGGMYHHGPSLRQGG